jgi:uncharacterized radical SAM protein YgiQ
MKRAQPRFLPMTLKEGEELGIGQFDIILITGDAYVDHPSFGTALIGRVLWEAGYSVGVIARPDWKNPEEFKKLGVPRLFFSISSGNVDSMVNNFTPALKRRKEDVYGPGGKPGRPDRALLVYTDMVHSLFPGVPIIIAGIEASLRRFAHYDYWSDSVRRSVLADAPADLLVFGMAERQVLEIAGRLSKDGDIRSIRDIPGTSYKMPLAEWRSGVHEEIVLLPSFDEVSRDQSAYARAFAAHYREQDPVRGKALAQVHPKTVVLQNPPAKPLSGSELDRIYELPFRRESHPSYREPVPALEPVRFSITSHRGCFGACSFCALTHHQGRIIQSRSIASVVREARQIVRMEGFKGIIQDIGGPTANMFMASCPAWEKAGACADRNCTVCPSLRTAHEDQVTLLREVGKIPGVKRVFISSGIRYDLIDREKTSYLEEVVTRHTPGHLKVAPEHVSRRVTQLMNKPPVDVFDRFLTDFRELSASIGKKQYLLPYFMSGHPGCTVDDMVELALYIRDHDLYTEQVQDFTPTPMSISTCMYHTGLDPFTQTPVYIPKGREKLVQRALLRFRDQDNKELVIEGLRSSGRSDLIKELIGHGGVSLPRTMKPMDKSGKNPGLRRPAGSLRTPDKPGNTSKKSSGNNKEK